jgi:hypothetical protein
MSKIHDNFDANLDRVGLNYKFYLYSGYTTTSVNNYNFLKTFIDSQNNLFINNLKIIPKDIINSEYYIACKPNEYAIFIEKNDGKLYFYDLNGILIFSYNTNSNPIFVEDNFNFNNNTNTIYIKDINRNNMFKFLTDYNSNIISIKDYVNNPIDFPNYIVFNIEKNPPPIGQFNDLLISPLFNNTKIIFSNDYIINIPYFSYEIENINVSIIKIIDNNYSFNSNLINISNIIKNNSDEFTIFYSEKYFIFGYILFYSNISHVYNFKNKLLNTFNSRIFGIIIDTILNNIYFYNDNNNDKLTISIDLCYYFNNANNQLIGSSLNSDGFQGLVPKPLIVDRLKFLRGDGKWEFISSINSGIVYNDNGSFRSANISDFPILNQNTLGIASGNQLFITNPTSNAITLTNPNGQTISSGKLITTDNLFISNSDNLIPTQKAIKTYILNNTLKNIPLAQNNNIPIFQNYNIIDSLREFTTDGEFIDNSDFLIPTQKAIKTFFENNISIVRVDGLPNNLVGINNDLTLKDSGLSISSDPLLLENSDLKISTQKAVKTYIDKKQSLIVNPNLNAITLLNNNGQIYDSGIIITTDFLNPSNSKLSTNLALQNYLNINFQKIFPTITNNVAIFNNQSQVIDSGFSISTTFGNSNSIISTQNATKTYIDIQSPALLNAQIHVGNNGNKSTFISGVISLNQSGVTDFNIQYTFYNNPLDTSIILSNNFSYFTIDKITNIFFPNNIKNNSCYKIYNSDLSINQLIINYNLNSFIYLFPNDFIEVTVFNNIIFPINLPNKRLLEIYNISNNLSLSTNNFYNNKRIFYKSYILSNILINNNLTMVDNNLKYPSNYVIESCINIQLINSSEFLCNPVDISLKSTINGLILINKLNYSPTNICTIKIFYV